MCRISPAGAFHKGTLLMKIGCDLDNVAVDIMAGAKAALARDLGIPVTEIIDTHIYWKPFSHLRSEEHTSELQSLMRNSYAVFSLKKKEKIIHNLLNPNLTPPSTSTTKTT